MWGFESRGRLPYPGTSGRCCPGLCRAHLPSGIPICLWMSDRAVVSPFRLRRRVGLRANQVDAAVEAEGAVPFC